MDERATVRIVITLDQARQTISFDLENCDHAQAQEIILATAVENHRQMMSEGGPHPGPLPNLGEGGERGGNDGGVDDDV